MFGFLNVYKPKGITSHDVVACLRRVTKIKQIGHTGTLDPFAEGVLPICIGKATRLIEYLNDDKAYVGTVQFGAATTTYDIEGERVKFSEKKISNEEIEFALNNFRGEIEQLPPIYSAIKINGKKLYEYAREGKEVEIKPRKVNISKLKLMNFNSELQQAELYIECSKGTYIRSIANDLGEILGVYGHLIKLVRVKAGDFEINDSIALDKLNSAEQIENNIIYPLKKLHIPTYELNEKEKIIISNGGSLNAYINSPFVCLTYKGVLCAVASSQNTGLKCEKVFL